MLTAPQFTAIAVALVVFFGLIMPGLTRYVLLGATAVVLAGSFILGDGLGLTTIFPR